MKRTAVITGATSGIGAAFARRLAADGYDLLITGRREPVIRRLAEELSEKHRASVTVVTAELSDGADVRKLEGRIRRMDAIDILVNNAGFGVYASFAASNIDDQEGMVKVHVTTPMRLIHAALPKMIARKKGAIINLSSVGSFLPMRNNGIYGGTKSFLNIFSECLQMELREHGIAVQALCPGFTRTDFHRKLELKPEEYAQLERYRWLSADDVVDYSLACLGKRKVICVPGFSYRALVALSRFIPRRLYYAAMAAMD